jgi:hypothetical protein
MSCPCCLLARLLLLLLPGQGSSTMSRSRLGCSSCKRAPAGVATPIAPAAAQPLPHRLLLLLLCMPLPTFLLLSLMPKCSTSICSCINHCCCCIFCCLILSLSSRNVRLHVNILDAQAQAVRQALSRLVQLLLAEAIAAASWQEGGVEPAAEQLNTTA